MAQIQADTLTGSWIRWQPGQGEQCQASGKHGQCPYQAKPGSQYCPRHSSAQDSLAAKKAANAYRLQEYQERMEEFTVHSEIKNLRAEIGILRMCLEKIINSCNGNDTQLIAYSGQISDMLIKVRTLVGACQKLEIQSGLLMDRDRVMLIGQRIVELVSAVVADGDTLEKLAEDIVAAIMDVTD